MLVTGSEDGVNVEEGRCRRIVLRAMVRMRYRQKMENA